FQRRELGERRVRIGFASAAAIVRIAPLARLAAAIAILEVAPAFAAWRTVTALGALPAAALARGRTALALRLVAALELAAPMTRAIAARLRPCRRRLAAWGSRNNRLAGRRGGLRGLRCARLRDRGLRTRTALAAFALGRTGVTRTALLGRTAGTPDLDHLRLGRFVFCRFLVSGFGFDGLFGRGRFGRSRLGRSLMRDRRSRDVDRRLGRGGF